MAKQKLTVERLREVLSYDAETGHFHWRVTLSRRAAAGTRAGAFSGVRGGRCVIRVDGRMYLAHRLAWMYVHGAWPEVQIDHANRDGTDNRLANLRVASAGENARNQGKKPSRSGLKGAAWDSSRQQYVATIRIPSGKRLHLGRFATAEAAHAAYVDAATTHHKEFACHG